MNAVSIVADSIRLSEKYYANLPGISLNNRLLRLRNSEREIVSEIIQGLSEMHSRRLYLELGYSSLFDYCTRGLGYSESGAYRRISVAKCVLSMPEVLNCLRSGKLNLTTASLIAPQLIEHPAKAFSLIEHAAGRTQNQVKEILALIQKPVSVPTERVRVVSVATVTDRNSDNFRKQTPNKVKNSRQTEVGALFGIGVESELLSSQKNSTGTESLPARLTASAFSQPTSFHSAPELRYELKFSVSSETQRKLDRARVMLSGKYPRGASLETVMEELLDSFLAEKAPKRLRHATKSGGDRTRHIPAAVRREVLKRDGGACVYVSPAGVRCGCTWDVELDHIVPFSRGGKHAADNLRVLCRAHNNHRNLP